MYTNLKRFGTLSLVVLLLVLAATGAASCGKSGDGGPTKPANATEGPGGDDLNDNLPERDYNKRNFNILIRSDWAYEFVPAGEGDTGEPINDAIYRRNLEVSERFNINVRTIALPGNWGDRTNFMNTLTNNVMAGDPTYDLVAGYAAYIGIVVPNGVFMNMKDMQYLNFNKPWWSQDAIREFAVGDKLYLCTGDLSLAMWKSISCMFFNKQMIADYGLENPYELVKSGKWTLDKMTEMIKEVSRVTEGTLDTSNNIYGIAFQNTHLTYNWQYAFGQPTTLKDKDNIPYIAIETPKTEAIMSKMIDFLYYTEGVHFTGETASLPFNPFGRSIFQEDRVLFLPDYLGSAETLRNMETDFGIIPYPKWDLDQKEYYTTTHDGVSLFGIPRSVSDPEACAIIMEALCAESYKRVVPAFYDVSLKGKITRDQESEEMIDLIRDSVVQNFGYVFNNCTTEGGTFGVTLRMLVVSADKNYASYMAANRDRLALRFDNYIQAVLDLED